MTNGAMATRQIYNLRWNNHTNNMLQVFLEQLANEKLVDVTLSCEGKFLKVHKIVLSACSPYFQELFFLHKEQSSVIILNGIKFDDLKSVVNFMYCGEIEVAEPQMKGVLAVAEALQVKGLSDVRASYENRHKKLKEKDKEEEDSTKEVAEDTSNKPVPLKKRKLEEETPPPPPSNGDGKKEVGISKQDTMSQKPTQKNVPEESKEDWNPESLIKQETLELDDDIEGGEEEEAEDTGFNWNKEIEKSDNSNHTHLAGDESREQGDALETNKTNDKLSTSVNEFSRPIITHVVGTNSRILVTNEKVYASTSTPPGNTARKTITSSQRVLPRDKIPRPPNAFMVFANEWRRKLAMLHHGENNKDISIRLGAMWKKLPPDAKESYFAAARRADEEHKIRYPGYTYNPKEARLRKILRQVAYKNSRVPIIAQVSSRENSVSVASAERQQGESSKVTEAH